MRYRLPSRRVVFLVTGFLLVTFCLNDANAQRRRRAAAPPVEDRDPAGWLHHLTGGLGGTVGQRDTAFTLGASYELRLGDSDRLLGIGAIFDTAFSIPQRTSVFGMLFLHPFHTDEYGEARLGVGPGADWSLNRTNLAFRSDVGWLFYLGSYTLTPHVALTFIGNRNRNVFSQQSTFIFMVDAGVTF